MCAWTLDELMIVPSAFAGSFDKTIQWFTTVYYRSSIQFSLTLDFVTEDEGADRMEGNDRTDLINLI